MMQTWTTGIRGSVLQCAHDRTEATFVELRRQLFLKRDEVRACTELEANPASLDAGANILGVVLETPGQWADDSGYRLVYALADGSSGVFPGVAGLIDHPSSSDLDERARAICRSAAEYLPGMEVCVGDQVPPPLAFSDYAMQSSDLHDRDAFDLESELDPSEVSVHDDADDDGEIVQISILLADEIRHAHAHERELEGGHSQWSPLYAAMCRLQRETARVSTPSSESAFEARARPTMESFSTVETIDTNAQASRPTEPEPTAPPLSDHVGNHVGDHADAHASERFTHRLLSYLARRSGVPSRAPITLSSDAPLPRLDDLGPDLATTHLGNGSSHESRSHVATAPESLRSDDVIDEMLASAHKRRFGRRLELRQVVTTASGTENVGFKLTLRRGPRGTRTLEIQPAD